MGFTVIDFKRKYIKKGGEEKVKRKKEKGKSKK